MKVQRLQLPKLSIKIIDSLKSKMEKGNKNMNTKSDILIIRTKYKKKRII